MHFSKSGLDSRLHSVTREQKLIIVLGKRWKMAPNSRNLVMLPSLIWFLSTGNILTVPPVNDYREEEINTSPLEADQNQVKFDFTPSANSGKMVLGDTSLPSSWSADFLNKSLYLAPPTKKYYYYI